MRKGASRLLQSDSKNDFKQSLIKKNIKTFVLFRLDSNFIHSTLCIGIKGALMTTHDLISKWIREANEEYNKAKTDLNLHKMVEIQRVIKALRILREGG